MKRITFLVAMLVLGIAALHAQNQRATADLRIDGDGYKAAFTKDALTEFMSDKDSVNMISSRSTGWGDIEVKFRVDGEDWNRLETGFTERRRIGPKSVEFVDSLYQMPLWMKRVYTLGEAGANLKVTIGNNTSRTYELGDVDMPVRGTSVYDGGARDAENPAQIFPCQFIMQHSIAMESSFILFSKPSGTGPWYLMTTGKDTPLEFFTADEDYRVYTWSACTGPEVKGNWRFPHTSKMLGPGETVTLEFNLFAVDRYEKLRDGLYEHGAADIRTSPGYVVPQDQAVTMAVRVMGNVNDVVAEHPSQTKIEYAGKGPGGANLYNIRFNRLGENYIKVLYGDGQETVAEFFSTEPVETLIKKRSSFLVNHQQHKAPGKWWDGLYSLYDMKYGKLRGPEDSDGFDGWRSYMLSCDDPILGKAPYLAAKNAVYPDSAEIASIDYHIDHYVWGGLQITDNDPKYPDYPYAVWGVPNYYVAQHKDLLAKVDSWTGDRMKIWRTYDYPHVGRLYWSMYLVAQEVPQWTEQSADEYLKRAVGTFKAYYKYPAEVDGDPVVYQWGIYDEWVVPDIVAELRKKGMDEDADFLQGEWEKKAKYFIYDDPYPYRSEYSFDRTAFESSYALAKYAVDTPMKPDENLWYNNYLEKWYSHPNVTTAAARSFMDRQHYAGLAVRGWLQPKFFLNGADVTSSASNSYTHSLTYMSMMAGWSILDYGLLFSDNLDWLELGYNSYMSTWALMNTGTPESNYGYWFPGKNNDGAVGQAFVSVKNGMTWIRKNDERGVWRYDGEIDLGLGAAFHTARTVLVEDGVFGLHVMGGDLETGRKLLTVSPKDGVRQQFSAVFPEYRVHISMDRDGFAPEKSINVDRKGKKVTMDIENRSGKAHEAVVKVRTGKTALVSATAGGKRVNVKKTATGYEFMLPVAVDGTVLTLKLR